MHRLKKKTQGPGDQPLASMEAAPAVPPVNPDYKPPKIWQLPIGVFGMKLVMETRFIGMIVCAVLIYVFGAVVANEWMYLLASGFLCAAVIGALIPFLILVDVKGECSMPGEVLSYEGTTVIIKLKRRNILGPFSWLIPAKWLRLNVDVARRGKDGRTFEKILPPEPVLIESLDDEKWFEFPTPLLKRGVYLLKGVEISTCFPLGIVWWSRTMKVQDNKKDISITVYPRLYPVSGNFMEHLRGVSSLMGMASHSSKITHQSTSFRSVREYKSGDSLRHVHWPSTARLGKMLVREFDQETIPVFDLLLNLRLPYKNAEQFELAVSTAISLCHLGYNRGQLPELLINPPIQSKEMQALMSDLPENINPGLQLYSEILARVELVSGNFRTSTDDDADALLDFSVVEKDVVTLIPSAEQVMKYHPEKGDVICSPLELIVVPFGWDFDEDAYASQGKEGFSMASLRKTKTRSQEDVKRAMGPTQGEVVGRIEWEKDLEAL
ncbi:DUF58 domain-containing protein [Candidatus Obscuribacterales bacterium]|nr:DUF58 domain-containing protein [Candidatus Obscuribacterales bacterium]